MNKNNLNLISLLAVLFPIHLLIDDYKRITYKLIDDIESVDIAINALINKNVIYVKDDRVFVNQSIQSKIYKSFQKLDSFQKNFYLKKLGEEIINLYQATIYAGLSQNFAEFIKCDSETYNSNKIKNMLGESVAQVLSNGNPGSFFDNEMVKIFTSPLISKKVQIAFINTLYKYNQNKHVVFYYNFLSDKNSIDTDTLFKVSSAFFMIGDTITAQEILNNIKSNNSTNRDVLIAVEIIELMNKFESETGKIEKNNLLIKFREIAEEVSNAPKNANLLLKISSSILSHDEAVNLLIKSDLSDHTVQTYNNIGALYLTEGYKRYLLNQKDTEYLNKADKYLNFATLLSKDKNEYSPYLELNKITLSFCKKYRKNMLNPSYKTIYNNYMKILGKADSLYFKSIITCNCYILSKILNLDCKITNTFVDKLNKIKMSTKDFKVIEKIEEFLKFTFGDRKLPIWIITESHY